MHCSPRDVMPGFDVSKGGSLILCNARIASGNELDWEPGEPIQRPQNPVVDVRGLCGVHCAVGWHLCHAQSLCCPYVGVVPMAGGASALCFQGHRLATWSSTSLRVRACQPVWCWRAGVTSERAACGGGGRSYFSERGTSGRGPQKPNQDSLIVMPFEGDTPRAMFGVFDGHGPFGEHASVSWATWLPRGVSLCVHSPWSRLRVRACLSCSSCSALLPHALDQGRARWVAVGAVAPLAASIVQCFEVSRWCHHRAPLLWRQACGSAC